MLSKRKNSQKPNHDFIDRFQNLFPGIVSQSVNEKPLRAEEQGLAPASSQGEITNRRATSPSDATNQGALPDGNDLNLTSPSEGLGSFPPFSHGFQFPGLYTPKLDGMGIISHNRAGDLHTPTGMYMKRPFSPSISMQTPSQYLHPMGFESFNPQVFGNYLGANSLDRQPIACDPSLLMHRDMAHDAMEVPASGLSFDGSKFGTSSGTTPSMDPLASLGDHAPCVSGERPRFHTSLDAPTAMVNTPDEIPVTYLNKGQPYKISVTDLNPPMSTSEPIRYRTVIRVSFDEEQQRLDPPASWGIWKEVRGVNEAPKRDGKLLAVEFVNPEHGAEAHIHRRVHLESNSVDAFCVTWGAKDSPSCDMFLRFNFLSTDFSHSKGVKGAAVRICAKTEIQSPAAESGPRSIEFAYCKAKLFRDHGAERKHSHDITHANKTIRKLKDQIAEAEVSGGFVKRRRHNESATTAPDYDQNHSQKKIPLVADLRSKLALAQGTFSSTRPLSVFDLRGDELDDPDSHPIWLSSSGEFLDSTTTNHPNACDSQAAAYMVPTPPSSRTPSTPQTLRNLEATTSPTANLNQAPSVQMAGGPLPVVGIDPTYVPPSESPSKPIACFYMRLGGAGQQTQDYYRALYLSERTTCALADRIAEKYNVDRTRIDHIIYINEKGIRIKIDDDVVRQIPEGQDIVMEINQIPGSGGRQGDAFGSALEIQLTF
ncbi:unnamed protein product [Penicillium olsonii]|nr:unnamed protein product [Penicillium olsonii]